MHFQGSHTHSTHHTQSSQCTHIFHTLTLYGIVSISVAAEGLATRDCAGLSRHGPDFTGYKESRLPLVSNSVRDKKKIFCLKKKIADYHNWQKCSSAILNTGRHHKKHKERGSSRSNYSIYNIWFLRLCFLLNNSCIIGEKKIVKPQEKKHLNIVVTNPRGRCAVTQAAQMSSNNFCMVSIDWRQSRGEGSQDLPGLFRP